MSFSGNYERPRLTESKIVRKIIDTQVVEIPTEQKLFNNLMVFLFNNYQTIIICIIIFIGLYWRYEDTKKRKQLQQMQNQNENENYYDF